MGSEFDFIRATRSRARTIGQAVVGIGDDCAVWRPAPGHDQLVSTDLLLEGVHFDLAYCPLPDLGHKAMAVNLSDIAAMGGVPRYAVVGLASEGDPEGFRPLMDGLLAEADAHGVQLAGGDTCRSAGGLVLSVTIFGELPEGSAVTRSGARPGDGIYVTGTLGDSAAGLVLLQAGESPSHPLAVRHLRPTARLAEGRALREAGIPSAMIDVSDGLLADLGHILEESGVGAEVALERVPLSEALRARGGGGAEMALSGGEDYELVFTVPAPEASRLAALNAAGPVTRIGTIRPAPGLILTRDGHEVPLPKAGFDHFAP